MKVKFSIWPTIVFSVLASWLIAASIADHNWFLLASGTLFAIIAILALGHDVIITNTRIDWQTTIFTFPIAKWNVDLSKAYGYYLVPKWLGPLSVLVITDGTKGYVVTPFQKNKKRIIRHLEHRMRNIAA
jgi:hypothetical protein